MRAYCWFGLLGAMVASLSCHSEDLHDGYPVSFWIANLSSPDSAIRKRAADALLQDLSHSSAAIHTLMRVLSTEQYGNVHPLLAEGLRTLGSAKAMSSTTSVSTLKLLAHDQHEPVREEAIRALGLIAASSSSPLAIETLSMALRDPDHDVRADAAEGLGQVGAAAAPVISQLLQVAKEDRIGWVRIQALTALGRIKAAPGTVVPVLAQAARVPSADERVAALVALRAFGAAAVQALPVIRKSSERDPDSDVRAAARQTYRVLEGMVSHP